MPPTKTKSDQPALPIDDKTQRTSDRRDQTPTQGPGSAAGELGDEATRKTFVEGAPIHDGKTITPEPDPDQGEHPNSPPPEPPAQPPRATMESDVKPAQAVGPKREPLPFYPQNADEMWRYATMLAGSDLLPRALKDKQTGKGIVANIHLVLMKGHDFSLKPMQSIGSINVIDGKAEVGALMMLSLVRRSGLCKSWRLVESTERRAIFSTTRVGEDEPTVFEYTIEEADQMGLLDKGKSDWAKENNQWKRQPRTMLRRRCQSMLLREVYSDVVLGLYDYEELSEMREVAERLGMREEQVAGAIDIADSPLRALPDASSPGPVARMRSALTEKPVDPLKVRLAAKAHGGLVARCCMCDAVLDPRDSDPCIACRPEPSPTP